ncbi:hypothetical protein KQI84_11090 [bacterium]|nr:hypothetical protein [bacterium]
MTVSNSCEASNRSGRPSAWLTRYRMSRARFRFSANRSASKPSVVGG